MTMQYPAITSLGLPPEKHADRVVAEMLREIVKARGERWHKMRAVMAERRNDASPAQQERLFKKMQEAAKGFLLGSWLDTGKRGRYQMEFLMLDGWNAETNAPIAPGDPIPDKPWIALSAVWRRGKGGHRYEVEGGAVLLITHHALSRLTQRCGGVRRLPEVYGAVQRIAVTFNNKMPKTEVRDGQQMRVELRDGLGAVICVLSPHRDGNGGVVLPTLWRDGEVADA